MYPSVQLFICTSNVFKCSNDLVVQRKWGLLNFCVFHWIETSIEGSFEQNDIFLQSAVSSLLNGKKGFFISVQNIFASIWPLNANRSVILKINLKKTQRRKTLIKEWFPLPIWQYQWRLSGHNHPFPRTINRFHQRQSSDLEIENCICSNCFFSSQSYVVSAFLSCNLKFHFSRENYENPLFWRNTKCIKIRKMGLKYLWWIFVLVSWIFYADLFLWSKVWLMFWRSWEVVITAAVAAWNDQLANLSEKWQQTICHNQNQKRLPRPTFLPHNIDKRHRCLWSSTFPYNHGLQKEEEKAICPIYQNTYFHFSESIWFAGHCQLQNSVSDIYFIHQSWFSILSFFLKLHENLLAAGTFSHKPEFSSN